MLRYFIERADLQQVNYICKQLNEVKNRLYLNDFDNPQKELELCNLKRFSQLLKMKIMKNWQIQITFLNAIFYCFAT